MKKEKKSKKDSMQLEYNKEGKKLKGEKAKKTLIEQNFNMAWMKNSVKENYEKI